MTVSSRLDFETLRLSQNGMIRRLGMEKELIQGTISAYELGNREPSLLILLKYARVAGVSMDTLVDDSILPKAVPAKLERKR